MRKSLPASVASRPHAGIKAQLVECYDRLSKHYATRTRPQIRDAYLAPFAALPRGSHVLDAGCGTGHDAAALAEWGHHVTAVDLSPAMCTLAATRVACHPQVELIEGDTDHLDTPARPYDGVLSALEVFHHSELALTLDGYAAQLRPGGLLVLTTNHPIRNMLLRQDHDYFYEGLVMEDWGTQGLVPKFHWTLATYLSALQSAGLRLESVLEHPASSDLTALQDSAIRLKASYPSLLTFCCRK